jgi:hypothetical protein
MDRDSSRHGRTGRNVGWSRAGRPRTAPGPATAYTCTAASGLSGFVRVSPDLTRGRGRAACPGCLAVFSRATCVLCSSARRKRSGLALARAAAATSTPVAAAAARWTLEPSLVASTVSVPACQRVWCRISLRPLPSPPHRSIIR